MDGVGRSGRPGPRTRVQLEAAALEEQRQRWRDRQRNSRANRVAPFVAHNEQQDAAEVPAEDQIRWGCVRHRTSVWRSGQRIIAALTQLLERIRDPDFRAAVLEKVFSSRSVRLLLPDYYPTPQEVRAQRQILPNVKSDLLALKVPHSSGMLARKRTILEVVVSELDSDISKFHSILGTRKANLVAAVERLQLATKTTSSRYHVPSRKKREGGIPDKVKAAVLLWWTEGTRVTPRRRDVRRKRLGRNLYDTHAAHLLLESQMQLFSRFIDAHPDFSIQHRVFINLRPFFVIKCKERNVCCCRYHIQVLFLLQALNAFRDPQKGAHVIFNCNCQCTVCDIGEEGLCNVGRSQYVGVTALWEALLCPKTEDEEFHRPRCLLGNCSRCGANFFEVCPLERVIDGTRSIQWKQFQYEVVGTGPNGQPKKRIKEAKLLHGCLPRGTVLTHIDFAENYTFEAQNEIQSMYYHSDQVTILVQVTYSPDDGDDALGEGIHLKRETHYYISDDRTHDIDFAQHCLMLHWRWMQSKGDSPSMHYVFSDGCTGKFKSAKAMYFVARYPALTSGCKMLWNYYGTGHGKGEWDGAGAVVKKAIRNEQLLNLARRLQNAEDCVIFLDATMARPVPARNGGMRSYRYFHHVRVEDVDHGNAHSCDAIPRSSKLHSIFAPNEHDPTKLLLRHLSCFYGPCLEEDFNQCEKKAYINAWTMAKIQPMNVLFAATHMAAKEDDDSWDYEYNGEGMADLVQPGDNFAILAAENNDEGVSFYILQCQRPKHIVDHAFDCVWGGHFEAGDFVISGTYYQKWGRWDANNYVYLRNSTAAFVDASLVLACKFNMIPRNHRVKGGDAVYYLPEETVDVINTALEEMDA